MDSPDPRTRYDDLIEERTTETVDEDGFAALESADPFDVGWAVSAIVLDENGRILLAYHRDDEAWLAPGGSVQRGESLHDAVSREVTEETGVSVTPVRPHAVVDHVVRHDGESRSFRLVVFSAIPETTAIGTSLGESGEPIEDARWFHDLPADVYERPLTARVLDRVRT